MCSADPTRPSSPPPNRCGGGGCSGGGGCGAGTDMLPCLGPCRADRTLSAATSTQTCTPVLRAERGGGKRFNCSADKDGRGARTGPRRRVTSSSSSSRGFRWCSGCSGGDGAEGGVTRGTTTGMAPPKAVAAPNGLAGQVTQGRPPGTGTEAAPGRNDCGAAPLAAQRSTADSHPGAHTGAGGLAATSVQGVGKRKREAALLACTLLSTTSSGGHLSSLAARQSCPCNTAISSSLRMSNARSLDFSSSPLRSTMSPGLQSQASVACSCSTPAAGLNSKK